MEISDVFDFIFLISFFIHDLGAQPRKANEMELKLAISKDVDVSFPMYSQVGRKFLDNSIFLLVVPSSGCSMIVRGRYPLFDFFFNLILFERYMWASR